MRRLFALLLLILAVAPGAAQWTPSPLSRGVGPAADYITPGQDEPGYRAWIAADPLRPVYVKSFNDYLVRNGVGGVAPTWQLLRTATDWQKCGAQPFDIPPPETWANLVTALRYIGSYVIPAVGPVEPVSNYRNPALNVCAKGAPTSTHLTGGAVDMVPIHPITREQLMSRLCRLHVDTGEWNMVGLGLYKGVRFHVDARKFREWGMAGALGGLGCPSVLAEGPMPYHDLLTTPAVPEATIQIDPLAPKP